MGLLHIPLERVDQSQLQALIAARAAEIRGFQGLLHLPPARKQAAGNLIPESDYPKIG